MAGITPAAWTAYACIVQAQPQSPTTRRAIREPMLSLPPSIFLGRRRQSRGLWDTEALKRSVQPFRVTLENFSKKKVAGTKCYHFFMEELVFFCEKALEPLYTSFSCWEKGLPMAQSTQTPIYKPIWGHRIIQRPVYWLLPLFNYKIKQNFFFSLLTSAWQGINTEGSWSWPDLLRNKGEHFPNFVGYSN